MTTGGPDIFHTIERCLARDAELGLTDRIDCIHVTPGITTKNFRKIYQAHYHRECKAHLVTIINLNTRTSCRTIRLKLPAHGRQGKRRWWKKYYTVAFTKRIIGSRYTAATIDIDGNIIGEKAVAV